MSTQLGGLRRFASRRKTDRWQPTGDPVFVVAGAKGGCGTSTLAALLALASAVDGRRTLLVDCDDMTGTHHRMLGVNAARGFASLHDPAVALDDVVVGLGSHLSLIPGGAGFDMSGAPLGTTERRAVFRRVGSLYQDFDAVFIDAGSRLDGVIAAGERGAWRFVAVASAEPVALASAYAMVKALETRWPGAPVEVLMNQHDEPRGRAGFEQIRAGAEHFLGRSVQFAGAIPRDAGVADAALAGRALTALGDAGAAGHAAQRIAIRLLAELDDAPSA